MGFSHSDFRRFTARFVLVRIVISSMNADESNSFFMNHIAILRRVMFSRSLKLMSLPQQVGAIEGLAIIIKEVPSLLPLSDQHLLAFLSELLKMSSVADGEMTDKSLENAVVDKNGFIFGSGGVNIDQNPSHASSLFYRRECVVIANGTKLVIPEELPMGVQLRVSSISLLHAVIRVYTDPFFDAAGTTPIGTLLNGGFIGFFVVSSSHWYF